jgi:hypothetical protein
MGLFSPRLKRQGREADHSAPYSTEVSSLPHTCSWRRVEVIKLRDNFTFNFWASLLLINVRYAQGISSKMFILD